MNKFFLGPRVLIYWEYTETNQIIVMPHQLITWKKGIDR